MEYSKSKAKERHKCKNVVKSLCIKFGKNFSLQGYVTISAKRKSVYPLYDGDFQILATECFNTVWIVLKRKRGEVIESRFDLVLTRNVGCDVKIHSIYFGTWNDDRDKAFRTALMKCRESKMKKVNLVVADDSLSVKLIRELMLQSQIEGICFMDDDKEPCPEMDYIFKTTWPSGTLLAGKMYELPQQCDLHTSVVKRIRVTPKKSNSRFDALVSAAVNL